MLFLVDLLADPALQVEIQKLGPAGLGCRQRSLESRSILLDSLFQHPSTLVQELHELGGDFLWKRQPIEEGEELTLQLLLANVGLGAATDNAAIGAMVGGG